MEPGLVQPGGAAALGAPNRIPGTNRRKRGDAAGLFTVVHGMRMRQQQS